MSVVLDADASTRAQVLHLVVARGPVTAGEIAQALRLTTPAVRRHLAALEAESKVAVRPAAAGAPQGPGRPARRYVAASGAHEHMAAAYADLALQVLDHLGSVAGEASVREFADRRAAELERRYAPAVRAAGADVAARAHALAGALADDAYEPSVRPVRGTSTLQLCQGHCPVQHVAAAFPAFCEAETAAFSRLLGVHVQRLATLAGGGHACTTSVQAAAPATTGPATTTTTTTIPTATAEGHRR